MTSARLRLGILDLDLDTAIEAQIGHMTRGISPKQVLLLAIKGGSSFRFPSHAGSALTSCISSRMAAGGEIVEVGVPTAALIRVLSAIFDCLSSTYPRLVTVPLLPWSGWSAGNEGYTLF